MRNVGRVVDGARSTFLAPLAQQPLPRVAPGSAGDWRTPPSARPSSPSTCTGPAWARSSSFAAPASSRRSWSCSNGSPCQRPPPSAPGPPPPATAPPRPSSAPAGCPTSLLPETPAARTSLPTATRSRAPSPVLPDTPPSASGSTRRAEPLGDPGCRLELPATAPPRTRRNRAPAAAGPMRGRMGCPMRESCSSPRTIAVLIVRTGTSLAQLEIDLRPSGPMSNARKCLRISGLFRADGW